MIKGKLIGSGATADVFDWTDNTIIKIFNNDEPDAAIEQEINNTKSLQNCSFKFPKFIQKLEYEGKTAVVYEKVFGTSMMKQLGENPLAYKKLAQKLAHLHFEVHKNQVNGIREQKQYFKERISWSNDLTDDKKERLYKLIDNMPSGDSLCHSDFHPDNVLSNEVENYIIDWADCCNGNACADVARTILTLKTAELPENASMFTKIIITFIRNRFCNIYTKEYLKISGKTMSEINEWNVAVAAYRICAAKKAEKSTMLKIINDYLEKVKE
ncbi:MAG: aminoglycoside phosphotransferase family protein [Bacillota bacterium]|nr:aminoglycoside phosphotransferase family protein [Bacillota bacterium]